MANGIIKQIGVGGTIGAVIGILGSLVGLAVGFSQDVGAGIFFTVLFGGMGFIFWFVMFKPMIERNRLLETGESAEATILSIAENGSSLKMGGAISKAGMTIQLEVRPQNKPAYRAMVNTYVSMFELAKYQPGSIVQVKFDPMNPQKVAIAEMTEPLGNFSSTQNIETPKSPNMTNQHPLQEEPQKETEKKSEHIAKQPIKIGDWLYIETELYLSHGVDDIQGGLAKVKSINDTGMIEFEGFESSFYNPNFLLSSQDELRKQFGEQKARLSPDVKPIFNEGGE